MDYIKRINFTICHAYYFIVYSFIGWCIETVYVSATQGRFVNRGLLNGPFCPIYGFGALILILLLEPVKNNVLLFFTGSVILTSILEYTTGYVLITYFNITAWDYSSEFLNLNGIISLKFSLAWGLLAVLFLYLFHPFMDKSISLIPTHYRYILFCLVYIIFIMDAALLIFFKYYDLNLHEIIPAIKQFSDKLFDCGEKYIKIFINY